MSAAATARESSPENDFADDLEQRFVAQISCDPSMLARALEIVEPSNFTNATAAKIFAAMSRLLDARRAATLAAVANELDRVGDLASIGGPVALAEVFDLEASAVGVLDAARGVRRRALERRECLLFQDGIEGTRLPGTRAELREIQDALAALDGGAQGNRDIDSVSFRGQRLLDLLKRPTPEPVCPGVPTLGHFTLRIAPSFTGKSSEQDWNAMARAAGVAPWGGAPARPPGRVLIYSIDEAPEQVVRRMNGFALLHPAGRLERYVENLEIIGPDREVDSDSLESLRFDEAGLVTLSRWIDEAEAEGDPFTEVYIDAYADVIPLGESENSNEEATRIGGALERLAVRTGAAIVLLHHAGKPRQDKGDSATDVRWLGRGASALAAKARVVESLEEVAGLPHLRRMRTKTNLGKAPKDALFQVCPPESDGEELLYFRPHDPLAEYKAEDLLSEEFITTNALAWALSGKEPETGKRPPGDCSSLAARLREEWLRQGLIEVVPGPNRSKQMRLKGGCA